MHLRQDDHGLNQFLNQDLSSVVVVGIQVGFAAAVVAVVAEIACVAPKIHRPIQRMECYDFRALVIQWLVAVVVALVLEPLVQVQQLVEHLILEEVWIWTVF